MPSLIRLLFSLVLTYGLKIASIRAGVGGPLVNVEEHKAQILCMIAKLPIHSLVCL